MDEVTKSSILKGCELARDLESRLQHLMSRPDSVTSTCEEIVRSFREAGERLTGTRSFGEGQAYSGGVRSLESLATRSDSIMRSATVLPGVKAGGDARAAAMALSSDSSRGSASSSFRAPRRDGAVKTVRRVAVPAIGNPDLPPDDGHTWRKYGQKKILHSNFLRGYFRCTHKKSYNCPAKRMVQRLDSNPSTFEVTYIHEHTCHLSSTAPSSAPPPPRSLPPPSHSAMTVLAAKSCNELPPRSLGFGDQGGSARDGGGVQINTMTSGDTREAEYAVAHMADVMFNSRGAGSSSSIMDLIFPGNARGDSKRDSSEG